MSANPFSDRRFRRLFVVGGAVASMRWLEIFAFALLTFDLTGSAFAVVVVGLVRLIPLGFGALVGLVAHRFRERSVIAVSLALGAAAHGTLALLALGDRVEVWHLAVVSFTSGIALAVDFTVRRPLLGALVRPEFSGRAVSLDLVANNGTKILAPAATGALIDGVGYPAVFGVGMAVYGLAVAITLLVDLSSVTATSGPVGWSDLGDAYRFSKRSPAILTNVAMTVVMNMLVIPYRHLVPVVGQESLGLNATRIGLLTATEGIGMTIGALTLAFRLRVHQYRAFLVGGTIVTPAAAIVFGLSTWLPLSMAALFVAGFGLSCFSTTQVAIVVAEAAPELRSRVMGLVGTVIGLNPVGLLLLGGLATAFGPGGGVIALGTLGVAGAGIASRVASGRSDA